MPSSKTTPTLSSLENDLLNLVPTDGTRITSAQLVDAFYPNGAPFSARSIVTGRMRTIIRKIEAGAPGPKIHCTPRRGPISNEYWVVKD